MQGSQGITMLKLDELIKAQVKKDNNIIYGAQAIKAFSPMFARSTQDYDIYSNTPKASAIKLERTLDKNSGGNYFFSKPAMHKGTFKVKHMGLDDKPNTRDDIDVADFTKPDRKVKTVTINGLRYVAIKEVEHDKKRSLKDKQFGFRHAKDKDDLSRIRFAKKYNFTMRR